jgi:SAM-dependent methyltransferase
MVRFNNKFMNVAYLAYRWIKPVFDPLGAARTLPAYVRYARDWVRYGGIPHAERRKLIDTAPVLGEATSTTPFDRHYFYQDIWAFRKIKASGTAEHIDIASRIDLVGFLSAICHVTFVDIRPLLVDLPNFRSVQASILALPYADGSVHSLSCLHVVEHIGLGRYGDPLDPLGSVKACKELARVLAPGGNLYFSCPVGIPRVCFNAHRIHSPAQILTYFSGLTLVEFSGIDDGKKFHADIAPETMEKSNYACGLFHFTKAAGS